jgi:hypothetical protein
MCLVPGTKRGSEARSRVGWCIQVWIIRGRRLRSSLAPRLQSCVWVQHEQLITITHPEAIGHAAEINQGWPMSGLASLWT